MQAVVSYGPISATISAPTIASGTYAICGQPWVAVGLGGTGTIDSYTPARTATGLHGAMKNPTQGHQQQGLDSRLYMDIGVPPFYNAALVATVPIAIAPGDVVWIAKSGSRPMQLEVTHGGEPPGWYWKTRGMLDDVMVVTVLEQPPAADAFRPGAHGTTRLNFRHADVNLDHLPSILLATANDPTFADMESACEPFFADLMDGWSGEGYSPVNQHPGYGSNWALLVSEALLLLMGPASDATKRPLALALVQQGIDQWSATLAGRTHGANGGHMMGRKALVIFAGLLLDDPDMVDPDAYLAALGTPRLDQFHENNAYVAIGGGAWDGPEEFKVYNGAAESLSYPPTAPSTWSADALFREDYHKHVADNVGTVLFMLATGLVEAYGIRVARCVMQHMLPRRAEWTAAMRGDYLGYQYQARTLRPGKHGFSRDAWDEVFPEVQRRQWGVRQALPPVSTDPILVCTTAPNYTAFDVELWYCPTATEMAGGTVSVYAGRLLATPVQENGWTRYMDNATPIATPAIPTDDFGYMKLTIALPDPSDAEVKQEGDWAVIVVFKTAAAATYPSNTIILDNLLPD